MLNLNDSKQVNPALNAYLRPIAGSCYKLYKDTLNGDQNIIARLDPSRRKSYKLIADKCIHRGWDGKAYVSDWMDKTSDDKLICKFCKAKAHYGFDDEGKKQLYAAGEVYETMAYFGPQFGFNVKMMDAVITAKVLNRYMILFYEFLCKQARNFEANSSVENKIGSYYMSSDEFGDFTKGIL